MLIKNKAFKIYSKGAAAQFKIAKLVDDAGQDKKGNALQQESYVVFVDAAKSLGTSDKTYDWKNKISIALGMADLAMFLNGFRLGFDLTKLPEGKKFEIFHDPGMGSPSKGQISKAMGITKGKDYGYMINFRQKAGEQSNSFSVPTDDGNMCILKLLFEEAVKLMAGFYPED